MQNPFQSQTGDKLSYFYKFSRIKLPNTQIFVNKSRILQIFANKTTLFSFLTPLKPPSTKRFLYYDFFRNDFFRNTIY